MSSISNRLDGHDRDIYKINIQLADIIKKLNERFDIRIMEEEEPAKDVKKENHPIEITYGILPDGIRAFERSYGRGLGYNGGSKRKTIKRKKNKMKNITRRYKK